MMVMIVQLVQWGEFIDGFYESVKFDPDVMK